jgi:PAS domain S-box-containing protein
MRVRLRFVFTVFLITGVVVGASILITFLFGNRVLRGHAREQVRREEITRLDHLESLMKDAETGQRGFIITGDETYLEPFNRASERLSTDLDKLHGFSSIGTTSAEIDQIAQLTRKKMAELGSTIELRRRGGFAAALAMVQAGSGKQLMDELRAGIEELKERQRIALEAEVMQSDRATRTRTAVFVFCGLLSLGFLFWAYRRIAEALKERELALREASTRGAELQQQKDLLSVTLASIGDCVMVTDRDGLITFMNPVAQQVTGWAIGEASGRPVAEVFQILNEESRQPVENPVEKVRREGAVVGLANHTILIRKNGSELPIDDSGAPIRDNEGAIRGVVLVFRDFSSHKESERELRIAKETAESANRAKDQFLAMLSHELRTPLTPVLATLNLWEASEEVPSSLRSEVQMLRRNIELEARIIDDLLDLTRVARGLLSFSPENTDIHALLDFLVGLSRSEFHLKELKATLHLNARRHHVHTDTTRLQQVLWNILRNAIKFTEEGGSVTVTTSNESDDTIDIVVSDTGIGMTPETIAKLFVPFEQADPSRNQRYGGLGLGLAISKALVDLLEGELSAESPGPGKGSTFRLRFPTTDSTAPQSEPARRARPPADKVRLLLVEDHTDTARALTRLLGHRGFIVEAVPTVATALEAVERSHFDLLLCDLGLPDGTGIHLIEEVRKNRQTPAIALTGFGMQQDIDRAIGAGFDAHLTKPVNLQKLEATIWSLLRE